MQHNQMIKRVKKYKKWGDYLKRRREGRFSSAREFWSQFSFSMSYAQYSRYESGLQLPTLNEALQMGSLLGVASPELCFEWLAAQLEENADAVTGELRESWGIQDRSIGTQSLNKQVPLDEVIVFNRAHLKLFLSDPRFRDIFTYVNSFAPDWVSATELSKALGLSEKKTKIMVNSLVDLGVLVEEQGSFRASKKNFYFPDDAEFFPLRNLNWNHNAEALLGLLTQDSIQRKDALRSLVSRELTQAQIRLIIDRLNSVLGEVVALPETNQPKGIYSLCVLFGERFQRASVN